MNAPQQPVTYFEQLTRYLTWQDERITELQRQLAQLQREVEALKGQRGVHIERIEYKFDQLKIERLEGALHIGITPDAAKSIDQLIAGGQDWTMNGAESAPSGGGATAQGGSAPGGSASVGATSDGQAAGRPASPGGAQAPSGGFAPSGGSPPVPGFPHPDGESDEALPDDGTRSRAARLVDDYLANQCPAYIRSAAARCGAKIGDDYVDLMVRDIRNQVEARIRHYARAEAGAEAAGAKAAERIASRVIADIRRAAERHVTAKAAKGDDSA